MRKIKHILVPTDFTEAADNAFAYANRLAIELDARITVLHVYTDEFIHPTPHILRRNLLDERKELAQKRIWKYVRQNAPDLPEGDLAVLPTVGINTIVKGGNPPEVINKIAELEQVDLIIMGTRDQHKTTDRILGSVATFVGRQAACPVLVIPPGVTFVPPKHIAYASDLSDGDLMDMQSLVYWAGKFKACIHWVHVDKTNDERVKTCGEEFEHIFQINAPALEVGFTRLEAPDLFTGLDAFVEEKDIDLLVMHPHRNKVFENIFKVSATKKMVHRTQVPLLLFHD
ncbi:MAG: universal stress protein [Bacteroidota bacterium]